MEIYAHALNISGLVSINSSTGKENVLFPIYVARNEYVPRFVYKELPIVYFTLGAIINIFLFIYLLKSRKYKSPTFTLVTSLTIADVICCISSPFFAGVVYPIMLLHGTIARYTCTVVVLVHHLSTLGSNYHLIFFAALRFCQLCFPLWSKVHVTCVSVLKGCIIIWIGTSAYVCSYGFQYAAVVALMKNKLVTMCDFQGYLPPYLGSALVFNTILPITSLASLHIIKWFIVARQSAKMKTDGREHKTPDGRYVTLVIGLFVISWFPASVYIFIQSKRIVNYQLYQDRVALTLLYVVFSNSAINPIMYCVAVKSVRQDVAKIISMICCKSTAATEPAITTTKF